MRLQQRTEALHDRPLAGLRVFDMTRVLAGPGIHDDFVAALTEQARNTRTTYEGGAGDADALVPPVNNVNQLAHVTGFLDRAADLADRRVASDLLERLGFTGGGHGEKARRLRPPNPRHRLRRTDGRI